MTVLVSALLLCVGLAFAATAAPGVAKKKHSANPLAGSWRGTTLQGNSVSFRITRKGKVLDFYGAVNLDQCADPGCGPNGTSGGPCPTPGLKATVSAPVSISLHKPVPGFPKGKLFTYEGPSGDPLGYNVLIRSKAYTATRISGELAAFGVPTPTGHCSGFKGNYTARKVG